MRILLAVTNGDLSGAPVHVRDLSIGLKCNGYDVLVVLGEDGEIARDLLDKGVKTVVMPSMRSSITPFNDLLNILRAYRIVKSYQPDLVHAHSSKAGLIFRLAGWLNRIPVVFTIHGWLTTKPGNTGGKFLYSLLERLLNKLTVVYIAVSHFDRLEGMRRFKIPDSKIITVHNGVADSLNEKAEGRALGTLKLIMVARDDPQKDYDTVFKAINGLQVHLTCVGKGTDSDQFKQRAKRLAPLTFKSINFVGLSSSVGEMLSQSDVFILSSHYEGLPISIIEAMRAGLPVVATDVGGVTELVDETNGGVFQRMDYQDLSQILRRYISNKELITLHGKSSRQRFSEQFVFVKMFKEIQNVYSNFIFR